MNAVKDPDVGTESNLKSNIPRGKDIELGNDSLEIRPNLDHMPAPNEAKTDYVKTFLTNCEQLGENFKKAIVLFEPDAGSPGSTLFGKTEAQ